MERKVGLRLLYSQLVGFLLLRLRGLGTDLFSNACAAGNRLRGWCWLFRSGVLLDRSSSSDGRDGCGAKERLNHAVTPRSAQGSAASSRCVHLVPVIRARVTQLTALTV